MAINFNQFFRAIAQQESGGSYSAVGPETAYGHAYGKYQVLETNIGPWTAQYWGKRLTPHQFLNSPEAQEAVAYGKLKDYWDRYGARGAASAWYSGDPDLHNSTEAQNGGPSIKAYVDSVLRIAQGMPNSAVSSSGVNATAVGGGGGGGGEEEYRMTPGERAEMYGLSLGLIRSNKELKALFDKAVKGSWSGDRFVASLKNTKWWRGNSRTERQYILLRYSDPATWKQDRKNAGVALRALAVQVGLKGLSGDVLNNAIYNKLALGWSDARLKNWLGGKVSPHDGEFLGEAGEIQDQLQQLTYLNGVRYSGDWMRKRIKAIAAGKDTIQSLENRIRRDAAAQYGAFANQIKAGMNVMDLAAPYISAVSQILELPDTDIDVFNRHVQRAMSAKGSNGGQYPLWQFEVDLRSDPKWRQTNNARESMMTTAHQVAIDFGVAF
jgi:hypothetical protein